jgi:hypothetical protein
MTREQLKQLEADLWGAADIYNSIGPISETLNETGVLCNFDAAAIEIDVSAIANEINWKVG